jgi:hyaluronan synthase
VRPLAGLALALLATGAAFAWWLAGGPNWYGVAVMSILAAETVLSWRAGDRDAIPATQPHDGELNVGVAVPLYNEDPAAVAACLASVLAQTRPVQSLVLVDDGSDDPLAAQVARTWVPRFAAKGIPMTVVEFATNQGKRRGLVSGLDAQADAQVLLGVDSDTVLAPNALAEALVPFADPRTTVVTGLVLAQNHDTNLLTRLTDLRYANAFLFERSAYSRLGSVLCACGSLAHYRTDVVRKYRQDFLSQTFLGRPAVFGDDRRLTNYGLLEGRVIFRASAVAYTVVPDRLTHFARQQVRWSKSFFRESLWVLRNMPVSKPAYWLTFLELATWLLFSTVLVAAVVVAPTVTGSVLVGPFLVYMALLSYARSVRYLEVTGERRSRGSIAYGFALAPLYAVVNIGLLVWLRIYALATLRRLTGGRVAPSRCACTARELRRGPGQCCPSRRRPVSGSGGSARNQHTAAVREAASGGWCVDVGPGGGGSEGDPRPLGGVGQTDAERADGVLAGSRGQAGPQTRGDVGPGVDLDGDE